MSEHQNILQIDTDVELQKIIRQLDSIPDQLKAPSVLASALNATANEMRRTMGKKAKKRYAITDDRILKEKKRGGMFLERATGDTLEAGLLSKGAMVEAMAYMTRRNTDTTAAMLKVLNESQLTALEVGGRKAFETTFDSGHTAIVRRLGENRLPIYPLMSPAVPLLYGKSYEEAEMDYYAILQKHIRRQIERTLERKAA
ncbi:hypothetical protein [Oscillibacter sp. CU971]|uniref:hypothetical protein n=1 Tax=Oscillibacter sp. CU971 TaxID=2780102 RepID=UPI00195F21E5|nr:hypothetical protein [Oscillibacter sp. CU971]